MENLKLNDVVKVVAHIPVHASEVDNYYFGKTSKGERVQLVRPLAAGKWLAKRVERFGFIHLDPVLHMVKG